jgi:hypothetical protein
LIAREGGKTVEFGQCFCGLALTEQLHGTLKFLLQLRFRIVDCRRALRRRPYDLGAKNVGAENARGEDAGDEDAAPEAKRNILHRECLDDQPLLGFVGPLAALKQLVSGVREVLDEFWIRGIAFGRVLSEHAVDHISRFT